ncbi:MAG: S-layer homology domain-containing protein [Clostridia bacterium]|nr:S-layer homology domain-containing protein [Clostridia bacterium]
MRLKGFAFFICLCLIVAVGVLPSFAEDGGDELLSPGLSVIAAQYEMVVSGVPGGEVVFSREDFVRTLGYKPESITLRSRPDSAVGQLTLGSVVIPAGQTLSLSNLDRIAFMPSASPSAEQAVFSFSADGSAYEYTCVVRLRDADEVNSAPTLDCATAAALSASVPEGGVCAGRLAASDPDGDALVYEIVSYPKHGSVLLADAESGKFIYRPTDGYTGKDSFKYTARDEWGEYASEAEVKVTVSRFSAPDFTDMSGSAETFARIVSAEGLMSGTLVGGESYFYPEKGVTRSEFTVMLMQAAGIETDEELQTVFADDAEISVSARPYVAKAYEMGLTDGWIEDGMQIFGGDEEISLAEAGVMTARLIGLDYDSALEVSLSPGEANWARREIAALANAGFVLGERSSSILDRATTAEILCGVMKIAEAGGMRK